MFINCKETTAKPTIKLAETAFAAIDHTQITWLAGAGFLVNYRGTILLIDPVLETQEDNSMISVIGGGLPLKVPYPIKTEQLPRVDYVLYTHIDDDHLEPKTAIKLNKFFHPQFLGTHQVFHRLVELGINYQQVITVQYKEHIKLTSDLNIEVTPADHQWQLLAPEKFKLGKPGDCCGFIISNRDARIYFPGDTRLMEEHLDIKDIDVLALDTSLCTYHLTPRGASVLANSLANAILLPYHYGTYDAPGNPAHCGDPYDLLDLIIDGNKRGRVLAPGEHICISQHIELHP